MKVTRKHVGLRVLLRHVEIPFEDREGIIRDVRWPTFLIDAAGVQVMWQIKKWRIVEVLS